MARGTGFAGHTILITGAGSGIGRLVALGASARGARVVIWDLDDAAGTTVRDEIRARGGVAERYAVNVADREAVAEAATRTLADVGQVDILLNNAGIVTGKRLLDASEEAIERTFAVNVLALFWTTRAFLPGMLDRGFGTIATVASAAGLVAVARQTDYSASKFAAIGFTESLRAELRAEHSAVRTLAIAPYYINTGMFAGVQTRFPRLLPIMEPEYVAEQILRGIERGTQLLVLPKQIRPVSALRALPVAAYDRMLDAFGLNQGMDHFTGRAPVSESAAGDILKA